MQKTGILLINLGTPSSPKLKDVRRYLTEFLNDPRVIDIPAFARFLLVNAIIVPFRAAKSAQNYTRLWAHNQGKSPLLYYTQKQAENLQKLLQIQKPESTVEVEWAMRYQNPSIQAVLARMRKENYSKIIVLPLFPQYASASSGSAIQRALEVLKDWLALPSIEVIGDFYEHPLYIAAMAEQGQRFDFDAYDKVLFSYHGLPLRQLNKAHVIGTCEDYGCQEKIDAQNQRCYLAQCYATSRALAQKLKLSPQKYQVVFQSRLGTEPWTQPFAEETIITLAQKGAKKLLVFSPAFVADCIETEIEIGEEYQEVFQKNGGIKIDLVPSLGESTLFVQCLYDLVRQRI